MQSVQRLHSTNNDQRRDNLAEWHGVHTVLHVTHTFIHEWNEPFCMHFVSVHQMASPEQGGAHLDQLATHLSTPKDESWVGLFWLTWKRMVYKWSNISYRSSVGQGKFAGQRPAFYHCATQPWVGSFVRSLLRAEVQPTLDSSAKTF